jgi:streptomycin 6-kinase
MRAFAAAGAAPAILAEDDGLGAVLIERVEPGTKLVASAAIDDDEATRSAAALIARLRTAPVEGAAGLPDLGRSIRGWLAWARRPAVVSVVGSDRLDTATALGRDLLASTARPVVLHGDLHHDNILERSDPPSPVAIDAQGLLGDPTYDLACLLRNPVDHRASAFGAVRRLEGRVAILAERLGDPVDRLRAWAFVGAVISAGWSAADDGVVEPWLEVADLVRGR